MKTTLSTKGQVVIPGPLRRRLGIRAGDPLDVRIEGESVVLTPRARRTRKPRIVTDSVTGLPVLSAGSGAPPLSSQQVRDVLANFP